MTMCYNQYSRDDGKLYQTGGSLPPEIPRKEEIAMYTLSALGTYIPGTVLKREEMGGVTGIEFLNKIFFISDGIMLAQLREISGLDGSTLQNWVKRGWIGNTVNKRYSKDQLARILIINMLRATMQLERIDFLLHYINGTIGDSSDDIISESMLYEYVCRVIEQISAKDGLSGMTRKEMCDIIAQATADYEEKMEGATHRLRSALEIIVIAYYASLLAAYSAELYEQLDKR